MKRILMFSLAVGGITLAAACGDDNEGPLIQRGELTILGDEPEQLPPGQVGVDYTATASATGGTQRLINWTLLEDPTQEERFPGGLYITTALNPLSISGRPTVSGEFDFRLQVTDSAGNSATKRFTLSIAPAPPELTITTAGPNLPAAPVSEPYDPIQFTAEGGSGSGYVFSADPNTLPPGMLLNASGELSGTPSRVGTYSFEVRVRDSVGETGSGTYSLEVFSDQEEFEVSTRNCPDGKVGELYECLIEMRGGTQPYTLAFGSGGGQPPGLDLEQPGSTGLSGALRGEPLQPGEYAFQIVATDANRGVDRQSFFVFIDEEDPPLRVTGRVLYPLIPDESGDPTEAFELQGYEVSRRTLVELVAIGGSGEGYVWDKVSGDFPPGCSFTSSTPNAILDCTPERAGCFFFELRVTDDNGQGEASIPREFELCVRPAVQPVSIPSATGLPGVTVLSTATAGSEYLVEIEGAGGLPAQGLGYGWAIVPSDGLPPGLDIDPTGAPRAFIRGTPTSTGTYDFNIAIYDVENRTTSAPFRIEVDGTSTGPGPGPGPNPGPVGGSFFDDFESGSLAADWVLSGNADWFVSSGSPLVGTFSLEGGNISDSQSTTVERDVVLLGTGTLTFEWEVSSELDFDFLEFYIDGNLEDAWSGSLSGSEVYTLSPGPHTLEWRYVKDFSASGGSDTAWIDDVRVVDPGP